MLCKHSRHSALSVGRKEPFTREWFAWANSLFALFVLEQGGFVEKSAGCRKEGGGLQMIEEIRWIHSLEKVYPDSAPEPAEICTSFLTGETFSIQCAFRASSAAGGMAEITLSGPFSAYAYVREVCPAPVRYAGCVQESGETRLYAPGLYPDRLRELTQNRVRLYPGQWHALWISVACEAGEDAPCGIHPLTLSIRPDGAKPTQAAIALEHIPAPLLPQRLLHTEWFHADCLADYYRVEPWSEAHWRITENFLSHYAARGMNMVLVPVLTPPLDTAVGHARTTVQLTEIREESPGHFCFGFEKLERYLALCRKAGIEQFEISHLFTQWGAKAAPKVMVWRGGALVRRFGWDTPSDGPDYLNFLEQFLKALTGRLNAWGMEGRVCFHLSDEPEGDALERYRFLRQTVSAWVAPYSIMDALSDYSFCTGGAADIAVPSMDALPLFAQKGVRPLWTYYCVSQNKGTPNRFMAMPACQVRILGILLYVYQADGFLHWGYNFYNSQYSLEHINPYAVTDAGGAFPAGDPFLVYPGADGKPEDSLRMMWMQEAMQDLRALQMLEQLWGRNRVLEFLMDRAGGVLTVTQWPRNADFLLDLRREVNDALKELVFSGE